MSLSFHFTLPFDGSNGVMSVHFLKVDVIVGWFAVFDLFFLCLCPLRSVAAGWMLLFSDDASSFPISLLNKSVMSASGERGGCGCVCRMRGVGCVVMGGEGDGDIGGDSMSIPNCIVGEWMSEFDGEVSWDSDMSKFALDEEDEISMIDGFVVVFLDVVFLLLLVSLLEGLLFFFMFLCVSSPTSLSTIFRCVSVSIASFSSSFLGFVVSLSVVKA